MAGPFLWWAGRLWGPVAAKYLAGRGPRAKRRTGRAIDLLERYDSWAVVLAYLLPVPSALIYAAAGWTGMSLRRFLLLDLVGTCLWVALIVGLGYAIGHSAVDVAHAITNYGLLRRLRSSLLRSSSWRSGHWRVNESPSTSTPESTGPDFCSVHPEWAVDPPSNVRAVLLPAT